VSVPVATTLALECGYCGRALDLPRLPATLVAQCSFCKKALDLAPAVAQTTALASAAPTPLPPAPAPEVSEEFDVRIARSADHVVLTLGTGSFHPLTSALVSGGALFLSLQVLLGPRFILAWPAWLTVLGSIPAVYAILWSLISRWTVTLGPDGISRKAWPWPWLERHHARSEIGLCEVQENVTRGKHGPLYSYSVELQVASVRLQPFLPRLMTQSRAWVVQREILQWLASGKKPPEGSR
jgi:hypothetical protein